MILEWKTREYETRDKGRAWYIGLGGLGIALLAYSIYTRAWTMTALVTLLVIVYVMAHRRQPRAIDIKISPKGICFGKKEFHYEQLKNFWYSRLEHIVTVNTKSKIIPQMTIHLENQDVPQIVATLKSHMEQVEEPEPSLLDNLYRTIGI